MEGIKFQDLKAAIHSGELYRIPAIPADWFKKNKGKGLFRKLADLKQEGCWLVSSSTSGDSSYTWRTEDDIQSIMDSFARAYRKAPECKAVAFMPDIDFLKKVGQRFAIDDRPVRFYATVPAEAAEKAFGNMDYLVKLNKLKTIWSMVKTGGKGRPVMEIQENILLSGIQAALRNETRLVFAVSVLILHPFLKGLSKKYRLGRNAFFVTGAGGWDGKKGTNRGDPVIKSAFVRDMCEKFGIPESCIETNFRDIYGTTENGKAQAGLYSQEHRDYVFEVEDDAKLYVINPVDGRPAKIGGRGYPRFISPHGTDGFAGACVQQNDLVTVVSLFDDGSVKQFTHISRASGESGAGGAGCAYELAEGVRL